MIITIDGPIATGKSSIAKRLAQEVGFIYFDTGAMYRCLTWDIMQSKIDLDNPNELEQFLKNLNFEIKIKHGERRYLVRNTDVTDDIRKDEVTSFVSKVSALSRVRDRLVSLQRELAVGVNAVFEGRDMGTIVFPHAEVKIFLTGRPEVRAKRRFDELRAKFPDDTQDLTMEKVLADLIKRDNYDSTRENSPLKQAPDAFVIDTSDLTIDEIVYKILEYKDTLTTKFNQVKG